MVIREIRYPVGVMPATDDGQMERVSMLFKLCHKRLTKRTDRLTDRASYTVSQMQRNYVHDYVIRTHVFTVHFGTNFRMIAGVVVVGLTHIE